MRNTRVLALAVRNDGRRFYLSKYEKEVSRMYCIRRRLMYIGESLLLY